MGHKMLGDTKVDAPLQIYLRRDLKEWLKAYAASQDLSMTTIIKLWILREQAATPQRLSSSLEAPTDDAQGSTAY